MSNTDRRLIEDLIPIREISAEASKEKIKHHGNISSLHIWWARRPIIASRAAVYGALVPVSSNKQERSVYIERMKKLCRWTIHQDTLEQAQQDILIANNGRAPKVLDMFAGGGSIPLEALRLGCEAYAVDLNPVAHIIELCTLVYPQEYGSSLVTDVKKWGKWIIQRAEEKLGELYTSGLNKEHNDERLIQNTFSNEQKKVQSLNIVTPSAYLWTRTVTCPNPYCGATVPLVRQTWLSKKDGNYIALKIVPDKMKHVRFEVVHAAKRSDVGFNPEEGSKRGNATCLHCGATVDLAYTKKEGNAGRIGQQLMAVVATRVGSRGKLYFGNVNEEEHIPNKKVIVEQIENLLQEGKINLPLEKMQDQDTLNIKLPLYGLTQFADIFTSRQLLTLLTFSVLVQQAYNAILEEGMEPKRATAITTYLGLLVDRLADRNSTISRWDNSRETIANTFAHQSLSMVWDFAEVNPFGTGSGNATGALSWILEVIQTLVNTGKPAQVHRTSATQLQVSDETFDLIVTDPPYYDNISYADLSDFFYVWLKRSIGFLYPEHFGSPLTPKKQEAVMAPYRHNKSKKIAKQSYENMMANAFSEAYRVLKPGAPLVCVYAHKTTLGWSTLVDALRRASFIIVEAWPIDTEMTSRSIAHGNGALTSSIFLVARRRESEETGDFIHQVRPQLVSIIEERLDTLLKEGVGGADLMIATIGAGLRAYTQFARVEMPNGDELDAKAYLVQVQREVIQHMLKRLMYTQQNGEQDEQASRDMQIVAIDTTTLFYVIGRFFYGDVPVPFDDMNLLARGMGLELDGPHGLAQEKKGLAKKVKDTAQLLDYRSRGNDESLGKRTESGNPAPLIDVLQRLLWLQEEQPYKVQDFLLHARPHIEHLRQVAETLAGPALAPTNGNGMTKHEKMEEQKAVETLVQGWRGIFSERARSSERSTRNMTLWEE